MKHDDAFLETTWWSEYGPPLAGLVLTLIVLVATVWVWRAW